jgi:hypothetical protein
MKHFFLLIITFLIFGTSGGMFSMEAEAENPPKKASDLFEEKEPGAFWRSAGLTDYTLLPQNEPKKGHAFFKNTVFTVTDFIRKMLIPLAILLTVWAGFQLIASRNDQELLEEKKRHVYGIAIGFVVIFLSTVLVDNVFFGETGNVLDNDKTIKEFAERGFTEMRGLFQYATTFVAAIAVGFIIFSAIKMMVTAGEKEEEIANLKKRLVYTTTGMVLLVSAQNFVKVFRDDDGKLAVPDVPDSIEIIVKWGNFILGLIGLFAVFGIVYSGIRLISTMGVDDEGTQDAKNILKACGIGLILAFSAWTLMYYFVTPLG